jgi:hypothetical protein
MTDNYETIFDLTEKGYFPSLELFLFPIVITFVYVYLRYFEKRDISKFKIVIYSFFTISILTSIAIFFNDFRLFDRNLKFYERGDYDVLQGNIEAFNEKAAYRYQTITVNGKTLFIKNGNSRSYSGVFENDFSKGDIVLIKYVRAYDGIVHISVVR